MNFNPQILTTELAVLEILMENAIGDFLEIGTYHGKTAAHMARRFPTRGIVAVDNWQTAYGTDAGNKKQFLDNTAGLCNIALVEGDSRVVLAPENRTGEIRPGRFGVILVDGDHSQDGVFTDGMNAYGLLSRKSFIVFHDFKNFEETRRGVMRFCSERRRSKHRVAGTACAWTEQELPAEFWNKLQDGVLLCK